MERIENLTKRLPIAGVVAFSLCSVSSLYHLFAGKASHPGPLLVLPAVALELVAAWTVAQVVHQVRQLTRSNISKQNRRFHTIIMVAFVVIAAPLIAVSTWANTVEFGNLLLGLLFPLASFGCAVGAALPQAVARFEQAVARERQETQAARKQRASERKQAQELDKLAASLGKAGETLALYSANPMLSQSKAAQELGISRQAVGQHLARLEAEGVIRRNGKGVEVLVEV